MRNPFAKAVIRWNDWNTEHCQKHGVAAWEVEYIIRHPEQRYPQRLGEKYLIIGRLSAGQRIQVVVVMDDVEWVQVYPIHARPL